MEFALDRALREMSIEEEKPVKLRSVSTVSTKERNGCILMGRLLNPENQKMSSLIHDMPWLWRTYHHTCGIALSKDRFQFIFDSESNLQSVLDARAWTYDEWSLVLERWVEKPSDDYLQLLPI